MGVKLEIHTFDPELVNALMGRQEVPEGEVLEMGGDARLIYERTFTGRVKHFPRVIHFEVEILGDGGASTVSSWLSEHIGRKSIDRILVEYQDVRMDLDRMRRLLGGER
jgi:hypothetical protein